MSELTKMFDEVKKHGVNISFLQLFEFIITHASEFDKLKNDFGELVKEVMEMKGEP